MMITYQFLFHTTYGVIHLKKELTRCGIDFMISDIPPQLTSRCGLSIRFSYQDDITQLAPFIFPGETSAIYQYDAEGEYQLIQTFPEAVS